MKLLKRLSLPVIMVLLAIGFWSSQSLQEIAAGIALFLFGMVSLERGIQGFSGGILERILRVSTKSTPRAMAFGLVSTSIVQSSTLVTVLSISFLSAGLMSLSAGIGVVFGSNLGSTTGAWLIAAFGLSISLSKMAMPMLIFGVLLLFQPSPNRAAIGNVLLGLGFIFMGIDYIKDGFSSVQSGFDLGSITPDGIFGILLLALFGIVATIILQSSHATILIVLTALSAGHITYEAAAAIVIGANVGTTLTAIIGAIGANTSGRRLAMAHVIFNVLTAIVALCTLPVLMWAVEHLATFLGIAENNDTLKLALFHTVFSVLGIALLLPVKGKFEQLLIRLVPSRETVMTTTQFLSDSALESPVTAVTVTRKESIHLYQLTNDLIIDGLGWSAEEFNRGHPLTFLKDIPNPQKNIQEQYETQLKPIYSEIIGFISSAHDQVHGIYDDQLQNLWHANMLLVESIKGIKHLQRNLLVYIHHDNKDIAEAYNALRLQIGEVLRAITNVHHNEDDIDSRLNLDHQHVLMERERETANHLIEQLIRSRKITTSMATSLMNDTSYTFNVCIALLKAARYLFTEDTTTHIQTAEALEITSDDVKTLNESVEDIQKP